MKEKKTYVICRECKKRIYDGDIRAYQPIDSIGDKRLPFHPKCFFKNKNIEPETKNRAIQQYYNLLSDKKYGKKLNETEKNIIREFSKLKSIIVSHELGEL